jgi:uncharacterized membrane protein YedE/YeeE
MRALVAVISGLLFAVGLGISGMTDPANVAGFLDVGGAWKPALAFVMGGALAVYAIAYRLVRRPLLDEKLHLPTEQRVTGRLVLGSLIFGAGWGFSGYCPGPALVSLGAVSISGAGLFAFVAAMLVGAWVVRGIEKAPAPAAAR